MEQVEGRRQQSGLLVAVVIATMTMSACSYFEQFFIINKTEVPNSVIAVGSVWRSVETGERLCSWTSHRSPPTQIDGIEASRVRSDYIPIKELDRPTAATFDDPSCSVRMTIEPGIALLVWESSNGRRSDFLTRVTLVEQNEAVEGADLLKLFRKRSRAVYVLEHK